MNVDLIYCSLVIANILFGGIIFFVNFKRRRKSNGSPWGWILVFKAVIGLLWMIIYLFVLLFSTNKVYNSIWMVDDLGRPLMTITLGILAASAIAGGKR